METTNFGKALEQEVNCKPSSTLCVFKIYAHSWMPRETNAIFYFIANDIFLLKI